MALQAPCWTKRQHVACRVDLHAQRGVSESDDKLTTVRTVFASSAPSFWFLLALLVPAPLQPFIKALSARFPDEKLSALHKAYEVIYDVSATLIEVGFSALPQHHLTLPQYQSNYTPFGQHMHVPV